MPTIPLTMSTETSPRDRLLTDFTPATYEQWRALTEEQLKGAPFEKKLVTRTLEGIDVQPLYRAADTEGLAHLGEAPGSGHYVRGTSAGGYRTHPWAIAQEVPYGTPARFNAAVRHDLMRGQSALNVLLDIATHNGQDPDAAETGEVCACGLSLATLDDCAAAFEGIYLDMIPVYIQSGVSGVGVLSLLAAYQTREKKPLTQLSGGLGYDPLGVLARAGTLPVSLEAAYNEMAALTEWCAANTPAFRPVMVNAETYREGGAHGVQELAYALATGVDYLRAMLARGLSIEEAAKSIRFTFALGPQFFLEVAKLRAARMLWSRVVEAFGGSDEARKMRVHGRTLLYNKTLTDPYVNMLRTTTEAFSGVVGGVESLHSGAFDEILREPSEFSRRIARNTQIVLQEECELGATVDPAGGSFLVEKLTDEVAQESWSLFQQIEKDGGMATALQKGSVQKAVGATAAERAKRFGQRRDVLVGTNQYANAKEEAPKMEMPDYAALHHTRSRELASYRISGEREGDEKVLDCLARVQQSAGAARIDAAVEAASAGGTLGEITRALRASAPGEPAKASALCIHRLSQPYEQLRGASAAFALSTGKPPQVFLCNMGPLRQHKLRADFTRGFLEPGGFEVVYPQGFQSAQDAAEAALGSGARVAVICSTDDTYPEDVPAVCQAIKAKDPDMYLMMAGFPGDKEAEYKQAGLDDYLFIKSDNYKVLETCLKKSGVL